jgi:RHS repeat-associated protein
MIPFQQRGESTSLAYLLARYHSPGLGRFLSVDPAGGESASPQTHNAYPYVQSNPLIFSDPRGETVYMVLYTEGNTKGDAEFRRAAETRAAEIENQEGFDPNVDTVLVRGVTTKKEVETAIEDANDLESTYGQVGELGLYSHAGPEDGPVFEYGMPDSSQFTPSEVSNLNIGWESGATARFFGCNTADSFAQMFADKQGVTTYGFEGYGYFSSDPDRQVGPGPTGPLYMIESPSLRNVRLALWTRSKVRGDVPVKPMVPRTPRAKR